MSIALTVLVVTFALLLFAGAPVFVVLALPSALYLILEGLPLELVPQRIFTGIDIFLLLAIPLFMLAGEVMNAGCLTDRLVEFSQALVGKVRGGLAMVNVLTSMLFAGITGSAAADASAIGSMMIPMMSKQGYPKAFSVSVTAASSIVGPIIPPSIVFIMYGVLASTSIIDLFLAGVVPEILLGLSQMAVIQLVARKRGFAPGQPTSAAKILFHRPARRARDGAAFHHPDPDSAADREDDWGRAAAPRGHHDAEPDGGHRDAAGGRVPVQGYAVVREPLRPDRGALRCVAR